jgi:hypothetical protein
MTAGHRLHEERQQCTIALRQTEGSLERLISAWHVPASFSGDRMHDAGTDCETGVTGGLVIKSMHCEIGPFE